MRRLGDDISETAFLVLTGVRSDEIGIARIVGDFLSRTLELAAMSVDVDVRNLTARTTAVRDYHASALGVIRIFNHIAQMIVPFN